MAAMAANVPDLAEARSSAFKALAPCRDPSTRSLLLFYAYAEPSWTEAAHKRVLARVIALGAEHGITGRGRCAAEGLNCTLTGAGPSVRRFCAALRQFDGTTFDAVDFKITDGLEERAVFKALTIRKTEELVGYGLAAGRAPALSASRAVHLEADAYHAALQNPSAVVIDVRNQYETEIGRIVPPAGGAELIDPKIRNSHEFPRWLNMPETKKRLAGKDVLMYCTGGIRCERASALLDVMAAGGAADCANRAAADALLASDRPPKSIAMVRGGIERYLRTFPGGGYWRGANYLFDRRFEQRPAGVEAPQCLGNCAKCGAPADEYRGKFVCVAKHCRVPVIVCAACREPAFADGDARKRLCATLECRLCREKYAGARNTPLPSCVSGLGSTRRAALPSARPPRKAKRAYARARRVLVKRLPLTVERAEVAGALGLLGGGAAAAQVSWLVDRDTGLFYGAAVVDAGSEDAAAKLVDRGARVRGKAVAIGFASDSLDAGPHAGDRPPVGAGGPPPKKKKRRK